MVAALLSICAVVPGAVATLLEHVGGPLRIAERHHSHHDTYVVSPDFLRSLVVAMLVVGCLGVLLGIFCMVGLFDADQVVVLAFSDAFCLTMFGLWLLLCRYKVSFFRDRAVITPFLGRDICFFYSDIESLDWKGSGAAPDTATWWSARRAAEAFASGASSTSSRSCFTWTASTCSRP